MNDLNELIKKLEEKKEFIKNPMDLIYEALEDVSSTSVKEALAIILKHNKEILANLKKENISLQEQIKKATSSHTTIENEKTIVEYEVSNEKFVGKDVADKVEKLFYTLDEIDFKKFVKSLSPEEIPYIKLELLKKIREFEKQLKQSIIFTPTKSVSIIQEDLQRAEAILKKLEPEAEKTNNSNTQVEYSNIIILPNKKNSTFLYDDISGYIESGKEIKVAIDKIVDGYFLKTKDVKPIVGKSEKLYEYKNPNGIRILYIVLPNDYIVITSLFYKDKEKSTKIDSYYDEAISRYTRTREDIETKLQNPDFYIEQAELIGSIYELLERNKSDKKSRGE